MSKKKSALNKLKIKIKYRGVTFETTGYSFIGLL